MSKGLRTAAVIVGVVALAAAGLGAVIGATAAAAASSAGIGALSITTLATSASILSGALGLASGIAAKKSRAKAAARQAAAPKAGDDRTQPANTDRAWSNGLVWIAGARMSAIALRHIVTELICWPMALIPTLTGSCAWTRCCHPISRPVAWRLGGPRRSSMGARSWMKILTRRAAASRGTIRLAGAQHRCYG